MAKRRQSGISGQQSAVRKEGRKEGTAAARGDEEGGVQMGAESRSANEDETRASEWKLDSLLAGVLVDVAQLTAQQQAVLREFVREPNDCRIARRLDLSPQTVRNHLARIQKKLKVCGRAELMKLAIAGLSKNDPSDLG